MTACQQLTESATAGVAPALRAVECVANDATARAFAGLFGGGGHLGPALHILLTLYVAFFAISLLTGRSRIGISALTPRMITLGLVLTFATSWIAYQSVVWNLAVGGPDQIARVLMGTHGSATNLFSRRIDVVFQAIADAASSAGSTAAEGASPPAAASAQGSATFTPANMMWLAGLMLLLGTVGVLIAARIALAVLLVLGPIFIVLALFEGTRGLFAGWVRGVVLTALTPLFAVLGGGIMLEMIVPVLAGLGGGDGIDGRAAVALFVLAVVHLALMAMVLRVLGTMVGGWSVFGLAHQSAGGRVTGQVALSATAPAASASVYAAPGAAVPPGRAVAMTAIPAAAVIVEAPVAAGNTARTRSLTDPVAPSGHALSPVRHQRARGVGSRFAAAARPSREVYR